ncbi:MAG: hypothetical protein ACUVRZ_06260 [Desulfobacca sp.]|uniref:hypothetical protein n=1 Tax=Desulfobacca sp. TaxID=2067990 RepID=UPI004049799D
MAWKPLARPTTTASTKTVSESRPEIILVGVVHGDPEGYTRTLSLLASYRPRVVSVEISDYSWRYRRRHANRWQQQLQAGLAALTAADRRHLALARLAAQIALPFEVRAARVFSRRYGRPWQAVDIAAFAREHLPTYSRELLQPANLRQLLTTPDGDFRAAVRQEYERARRLVNSPSPVRPLRLLTVAAQTTMREKVLASRVGRLARRWGRVVHLGGWEHLVRTDQHLTMADFLAPWQPQRLILADHHALGRANDVRNRHE